MSEEEKEIAEKPTESSPSPAPEGSPARQDQETKDDDAQPAGSPAPADEDRDRSKSPSPERNGSPPAAKRPSSPSSDSPSHKRQTRSPVSRDADTRDRDPRDRRNFDDRAPYEYRDGPFGRPHFPRDSRPQKTFVPTDYDAPPSADIAVDPFSSEEPRSAGYRDDRDNRYGRGGYHHHDTRRGAPPGADDYHRGPPPRYRDREYPRGRYPPNRQPPPEREREREPKPQPLDVNPEEPYLAARPSEKDDETKDKRPRDLKARYVAAKERLSELAKRKEDLKRIGQLEEDIVFLQGEAGTAREGKVTVDERYFKLVADCADLTKGM
eukprot:TRINITY_DN49727_c0_g1_i1.p1 TRINITY_DN49727_c0_g1~~TRINITY_DN49727_c0_g1_i1.p1  ORF type:complete len:338 (+),score=26.66 TRINITY_DN49727_c0_g1_i1:44-1015(+)